MNGQLGVGMLWLALAAALVAMALAVYAVVALLVWRRQIRELRSELQRQNTAMLALHGAMKMISEDVITHGQVQSSVKRALERLADQQSELRLRDVGEGLYPQAIRLIQDGRTREEVRQLCGLTQSELDLLFSLHAGRSPPA